MDLSIKKDLIPGIFEPSTSLQLELENNLFMTRMVQGTSSIAFELPDKKNDIQDAPLGKESEKTSAYEFVGIKDEPSSPCSRSLAADNNSESSNDHSRTNLKKKSKTVPSQDKSPENLTTMYPTVTASLDDRSNSPPSTMTINSSKTSSSKPNPGLRAAVSASKEFSCDICGRVFVSACNLYRHKRIYDSPNHAACGECNKVYNLKSDLEVHIESHKREYQCNVCGKEYTKSQYLKEHKRTHSATPPTCPVCKKTFGSSQYLRIHQKTHTDVNPIHFSCFVCKKIFNLKQNCIRHMSTHTKLYRCAICKKSFSLKPALKSHLLMHLGKLDHKCDQCEMSFNTKDHLSRHKRKHMPPRFACAHCDKKYKAKIDLILHCSMCSG